jgi:UDP-N-acetylmuramoyl-tripeptide--D-alanyl-D-alanine ligase
MTLALISLCVLGAIPSGLRWLRVAQREHYLAPSTTRFAVRWWSSGAANIVLSTLASIGVVGSIWSAWWGLLVVGAQVGPVGLSIKGTSSPLAWTRRLVRLAITTATLAAVVFVAAGITDSPVIAAAGLFLLPVIVDVALLALKPVERRLGGRWVDRAAARLRASGATVVGITGSYGKTSTKLYLAHLIEGSRRVVASPASYNNRMGLARAVNEQLVPGTEVFVAEMGTYGRGEISDLVSWLHPAVSALVAIGPVHLERFKTEENIVHAKAEILEGARAAVISIDHPLLAALARSRSRDLDVLTVSTESDEADVVVRHGSLVIDGEPVARVPDDVFPLNLGVAVALGMQLGVEPAAMLARIGDLPRAEHRQNVIVSERGFSIIDDTFNSNPAGARSGLAGLTRLAESGRKVVVTPGMVELGPMQVRENREFASLAANVADDLLVVGRTNRAALLEGASSGKASVTVVGSRRDAVDWVRQNLGTGDAVLYENDLPDHYP